MLAVLEHARCIGPCHPGHGQTVSARAQSTAFVLGGGGVLGSAEVGMLRALLERGVVPDVVVGSSVGALNGLAVAAEPKPTAIERLTETWTQLTSRQIFSTSLAGQVTNLIRHGTHLYDNAGLRRLLEDAGVRDVNIEDLPVRFQCVAASIERAGAHWFDSGPVMEAVLASCAVPGLLPPVEIGGEHFVDGGLVASVPLARAIDLGATRLFVLHVGRLERPLEAPRRPWEVGVVAFEIARRHQFVDELARLPEGVELHLLPSGSDPPSVTLRYRSSTDTSAVHQRIHSAYDATIAYLDRAGV